MAISIAWLLDKLGNKLYAWSTTKAVMDFDRGGSSGQTLEKTLNDGLIQEYICVTSGTTHALTGTGNNIKFVADAPFNEGDTITVNGSLVSAYTQDGEALTGGAWNTGMTVVCYLDGSTLNFKGGGGLSPADNAKLIPQNIRENITIAGVTGELVPINGLEVLMISFSVSGGYYNWYVRNASGEYDVKSVHLNPTGAVIGTVKLVAITGPTAGTICGHSGQGVYTTGHTNDYTMTGLSGAFVVLGTVN